jgi:hypothetical protein
MIPSKHSKKTEYNSLVFACRHIPQCKRSRDETAPENTASSTISANNFNSSSGGKSASTNPSIIIGAAVGGAFCLIAAVGVVWIIRRNRTTSLRNKKQISATTEIVIAQLENDNIQV